MEDANERARKEFQRVLLGRVPINRAMGSLSEGVLEFLIDKEYIEVTEDGLSITSLGKEYANHQYQHI